MNKASMLGILVGIMSSLVVGCDGGSSPAAMSKQPAVFEDFGTYSLPNSDYSLNVASGAELVDFKMTDSSGNTLVVSDLRPSVHQRWLFAWNAATNTLWFSSSDIGTFGWFRNSEGIFQKKKLTDMSIAEKNTAPQEFRTRLSSVVQKLFPE